MRNHLLCSLFTNESEFLQMKVPGALENVKFSLTSLPISVRPLAAYFIVNNRIYQSPDLYTVVSNRLVSDFEVF
jgi:hypothetical protein